MLRSDLDPEEPAQSSWSQSLYTKMTEERVVVERTVEEFVVREEEVEEILAEAKNAPVNGVLAPSDDIRLESDPRHPNPLSKSVSRPRTSPEAKWPLPGMRARWLIVPPK